MRIIAENYNDMEITETVGIFQNLAYPIAVSVVLFVCIAWFGRKMLDIFKTRESDNNKLVTKYLEHLETANTTLSKALSDNADALLKFSKVLEVIEHKLTTA